MNEDEEAAASSKGLVNDVIEIVVMSLPIKSLARFQLVSKPWRKIICTPKFNHRRSKSRPQQTDFIFNSGMLGARGRMMRFDSKNNSLSITENDYLRSLDSMTFKIINSRDGILLVRARARGSGYERGRMSSLYLVNPAIGEGSMTLILNAPLYDFLFPINYGHWYDSVHDDFMAAALYLAPEDKNISYSVFSLRVIGWSKKKPLPSRVSRLFLEAGVFIIGKFYFWDRKEGMLVIFDVRNETVSEFGGPKELENIDQQDLYLKLCEVRGSICLVCRDKEWSRLHVWLLMEGDAVWWREMIYMNEKENRVLEHSFRGEQDRVMCLDKKRLFIYNDENKVFEQKELPMPIDKEFCSVLSHCETVFIPRLRLPW